MFTECLLAAAGEDLIFHRPVQFVQIVLYYIGLVPMMILVSH